jgi:hypothetical protein
VLVYALGRTLEFGRIWCWAGTVLIATGPLYLRSSLQGMSDIPAMVWTCAAALAGWRARNSKAWAAVTGVALSISVLIRPNEVLLLAPLLVAWWPIGPARPAPGLFLRSLLFVGGGVPGGVFWLLYNRHVYGGALVTSYGDVKGLFLTDLLPTTLRFYAHWLPVVFTPVVWLCLGLPWAARRSRAAAFLGVWAGVFLALFAFNRYIDDSWSLIRYVLPAAPALVFGGLAVARRLLGQPYFQGRRWPRVVATLALAAALAGQIQWDGKLKVLYAGRGQFTYPLAMSWLNTHLPPGSILAAMQTSPAAFFYTDFPVVRWDELDPGSFRLLAKTAASQGRAIYAPLFAFEEQRALVANMPGRWSVASRVRQVTIWRYDGDRP